MDAQERARRIDMVATVLSRASYQQFYELLDGGENSGALEGAEFAHFEFLYKQLSRH